MALTPAIILTVFLPVLLFHGAYNLDISELRANLTSVALLAVPGVMVTAGLVGAVLHLAGGLPWSVAVLFGTIVAATRACLAESPPDLAQDVLETGLFLTGGGAMLRGLDMRLASECEVPVHLTEQPLTTVVMGAGRLLAYLPDYQSAILAGGRDE